MTITSPLNVILVIHRDALCHMIDLVDSNQSLSKFEHVISQTNDDELCVFRPLFNVARNDRDLRFS